jgi:hypothetical protein
MRNQEGNLSSELQLCAQLVHSIEYRVDPDTNVWAGRCPKRRRGMYLSDHGEDITSTRCDCSCCLESIELRLCCVADNR